MSRPIKIRAVCQKPEKNIFGPKNQDDQICIYMNLEEYETIRLIDYEGLNQEECASFMKVARTTVQRMYNEARRKISDALINGKTLKIKGGNYILCDKDQRSHECHKINCPRFISKIR
ncbi:MAG: DUF134 domain-containing protein [Bacilli bacterium]|jgi:predicted DNA-binding protein (UPF0251 family)